MSAAAKVANRKFTVLKAAIYSKIAKKTLYFRFPLFPRIQVASVIYVSAEILEQTAGDLSQHY